MALNLMFFNLIVKQETLALYDKNDVDEEDELWSDGRIAIANACMDPATANGMDNLAKEKGLQPITLEHPQGDYFLASQFMEGESTYFCDWLHVYRDVAWNPRCPMGRESMPIHFPCMVGGFYYESAVIWKETLKSLEIYNDIIQDGIAHGTLFLKSVDCDGFIRDLKFKTLIKDRVK